MDSQTAVVVMPDADEEGVKLLEGALEVVDTDGIEFRHVLGVPSSPSEWVDRLEGAQGVLLSWKMPDEVLTESPGLEVVSFSGTGAGDHVDLHLSRELGITVCNVRGYGDDAVAEHAIALLFAAVRNIPNVDRRVRGGEWPQDSSWQLRGKKLGVVGLGGIGRRVAELGSALGMEVKGWSRSAETGAETSSGIPLLPLDELFSTCDAVSLHVAFTEQTERLVGAKLLNSMPSHAVLVNTARGPIIDQDALLTVLKEGRIHGAALDVFASEPIAANDPILKCERAVLTSHLAFNTAEASQLLMRRTVENLVEYFRGNPINVVNARV